MAEFKKYKVIALSVGGKANKVFNSGDIVRDIDFITGRAELLVKLGFLLPYSREKTTNEKISILAAVWRRPEIFKIFCESITMLKGNISVMIAGSPNDQCEDIAKKYGFDYVRSPNERLAFKLNQAAMNLKRHNPDRVLMLGSDDIINQPLLDWYLSRDEDYLYLLDFYFYDTRTKKAVYWGGYDQNNNRGHACGAGRVLNSYLMQQLKWQPWALNMDRILDSAMDKQLKNCSYTAHGIYLRDNPALLGVDLKSSTNMTPFALWPNSKFIGALEMLKKNFPDSLVKQISHV